MASRRGEIALAARADDGTPRGAVFIPFAFYEAAANLLTNAALDPFGKIAEVKYCAVKVRKGGELEALASYGGGQSFAEKAKAREAGGPSKGAPLRVGEHRPARRSQRLQIVGFLRMFSTRSIERTFTSRTSEPLQHLERHLDAGRARRTRGGGRSRRRLLDLLARRARG